MDIELFTQMLKDKHFTDYKRMQYKYGNKFNEFLDLLEKLFYQPLPIMDLDNIPLVFEPDNARVRTDAVKVLLKSRDGKYGIKAAEEEIISSSAIENIDLSRDSVRNILKGLAPEDEQENMIFGIKKGFDFIAEKSNKITEENLYKLYMMTVGDFLSTDNKLKDGCFYRDDAVYIRSDHVEHTGISYKFLPKYMRDLLRFINDEDDIDDLVKAAIIHFYIAYLHPYFDGNGRTARLVHLCFLIQKDYGSALFIPFSGRIEKSRKAYYDAFTAVEKNRKISGVVDVTPFIMYFINNVYNKIPDDTLVSDTLSVYSSALSSGQITEKEEKLWQFVLSFYGTEEFSTKQLEKDFGNAAYATIRSFVLKFQKLGLLAVKSYGARNKYRVIK